MMFNYFLKILILKSKLRKIPPFFGRVLSSFIRVEKEQPFLQKITTVFLVMNCLMKDLHVSFCAHTLQELWMIELKITRILQKEIIFASKKIMNKVITTGQLDPFISTADKILYLLCSADFTCKLYLSG